MSLSLKFLAFYLIPCCILVSCRAPPEHVNPIPVLNETNTANGTRNQEQAAEHTAGVASKIPEPSGKNALTNIADVAANKTGGSHSIATNVTGSSQSTVAPKTAGQPAVPGSHPTPSATHGLKNATIPAVIFVPHDANLPPHHKKDHPTADPPQASSTVAHVAVPIRRLPESENVLEDVVHPAPRPLRAAEKFNPTFGAIVAAICITTAVGGYVILMTWRKIEMDRYGNRQMLINEDDFGDIQDEDMRHFEMQELRSVNLALSPSHRKTLSRLEEGYQGCPG